VSAVTDTVGAVCYRHPDRPTGLSCSECGRPICVSCSIDAAVGQRCPECIKQAGPQQVIRAGDVLGRPSYRTAPVTFTIIAVAVGIELVSVVAPSLWNAIVDATAMWNRGVYQGEWWRTVSVVLVHAGFMHVGFNMLALYSLGPHLERQVGKIAYLLMFLASAAAGSAAVFFTDSVDAVGVGASGAIFGAFGIWTALAYRRRHTRAGRAALNQMWGLLAINALIPFVIRSVAWQAHVGGLLAGLLIGWLWTMPPVAKNAVARSVIAAGVLVVSIALTQLVSPSWAP
jgi:membrane associated rhomboid family serine protease